VNLGRAIRIAQCPFFVRYAVVSGRTEEAARAAMERSAASYKVLGFLKRLT